MALASPFLSMKEPNQGSKVGHYQSREDASRSVLVTNCPTAGGELAPIEAFVSSRDEAERGASWRTRDWKKWKAGDLPRPNCQTRAGIFVLWSVRRRTKEAAAAAQVAAGTDYQRSLAALSLLSFDLNHSPSSQHVIWLPVVFVAHQHVHRRLFTSASPLRGAMAAPRPFFVQVV